MRLFGAKPLSVRGQAIIWIDDAFRVRCEQKAHSEEFRRFFAVSLNKLVKNSPDTGLFQTLWRLYKFNIVGDLPMWYILSNTSRA